jgi:tRNA pseudouridine65 synthase
MQEQEPFRILYRDDDCIAIAKRPGIHVHHSTLSPHEISCMPILRDQIGSYVYPIHRIDRATSGIVLFALSNEALSSFNEMMWSGGMKKRYHAIIRGWMDDQICDSPITIDEKTFEAETHFRSIIQAEMEYPSQHFSSTRISLIEAELITGRRHQIRKHCAHLRHPIAGDVRYGDGRFNMLFRTQYAIHRLLLFATSLQFIHPITQQEIFINYDPRSEDEGLDRFCAKYGFIFD